LEEYLKKTRALGYEGLECDYVDIEPDPALFAAMLAEADLQIASVPYYCEFEKTVDEAKIRTAVEKTAAAGGKKILAIPGFLEVDVVYTATRAMRQTPHRFYECKDVLERFADCFIHMLEQFDYQKDTRVDDLHAMFGTLCCLAELQSALPGKILSTKPLRLVLDRRPFI
jgi:sugar phosphate isomerase/epimerase